MLYCATWPALIFGAFATLVTPTSGQLIVMITGPAELLLRDRHPSYPSSPPSPCSTWCRTARSLVVTEMLTLRVASTAGFDVPEVAVQVGTHDLDARCVRVLVAGRGVGAAHGPALGRAARQHVRQHHARVDTRAQRRHFDVVLRHLSGVDLRRFATLVTPTSGQSHGDDHRTGRVVLRVDIRLARHRHRRRVRLGAALRGGRSSPRCSRCAWHPRPG